MAKTPDRLVGPAQIATGPTTVFTAPAGGTLARWVRVSNPSGGAVTFTLSVGVDAASTRVYDAVSIATGGVFFDYPYLELDEGEILQVSASANNVLVLTVGGDALQSLGLFGAARVLGPFPFAFDDAGLNDGIEFYTPTVGDILLDAWVEVTTEWDGTTPKGDLGTFVASGNAGLFSFYNFVLNLDSPDVESAGTGTLAGSTSSNRNVSLASASLLTRGAPLRFTAANPLLFVVSQDGTKGGTSPGASQGQANVYLVVSTPVTT